MVVVTGNKFYAVTIIIIIITTIRTLIKRHKSRDIHSEALYMSV